MTRTINILCAIVAVLSAYALPNAHAKQRSTVHARAPLHANNFAPEAAPRSSWLE